MKLPDRIIGSLDIKGINSPFEFDKDSFELKLYKPFSHFGMEEIRKGVWVSASNPTEHTWVESLVIKGTTSEKYLIYFGTFDDPSSYNGFLTYSIDWYYISGDSPEKICDLLFSGREVDFFYNPSRAFNTNLVLNEENPNNFAKTIVQTVNSDSFDCGSYVKDNIRIDVSCAIATNTHFQSNIPLDSHSILQLHFSDSISLEQLIDCARAVELFFTYICYRTNIEFTDVFTYSMRENGKKQEIGKLVFNNRHEKETNNKAKNRIIQSRYLCQHVATLLESIGAEELSFGHYCKSINDMAQYSPSKIIMILSAFEREFRNIYGSDVRRSQEYKQTKVDIIRMLNEYSNTLSGKQKKYVKGFAKGIENSDSSYGDNLLFALEDCRDIMEPFVTYRYKGSYQEIIEEISININEIRNGIAHNRMDMEIEARNIADIHIVEELLYAIRLKKIGIDSSTIKIAIIDLFNEPISLKF